MGYSFFIIVDFRCSARTGNKRPRPSHKRGRGLQERKLVIKERGRGRTIGNAEKKTSKTEHLEKLGALASTPCFTAYDKRGSRQNCCSIDHHHKERFGRNMLDCASGKRPSLDPPSVAPSSASFAWTLRSLHSFSRLPLASRSPLPTPSPRDRGTSPRAPPCESTPTAVVRVVAHAQ